MRDIAKIKFSLAPNIVNRIADFSTRAYDLCQKRNAIVHGNYFDFKPFMKLEGPTAEDLSYMTEEESVLLNTKVDGSGDIYKASVSKIERLGEKIYDLMTEGLFIFYPPGPDSSSILEPDELSVLREYHRDFPAPRQTGAPIRRDPRRKGNPRQPEPFRA